MHFGISVTGQYDIFLIKTYEIEQILFGNTSATGVFHTRKSSNTKRLLRMKVLISVDHAFRALYSSVPYYYS